MDIKNLPLATPMLTQRHKEKQVEWAKKIFELQLEEGFIMDETALKFSHGVKGTTSLFCFQSIMTGNFYVEILQNHLPEVRAIKRQVVL